MANYNVFLIIRNIDFSFPNSKGAGADDDDSPVVAEESNANVTQMPQKILSKFNKLNSGHKKITKSVRNHIPIENDTDSDSSSSDLYTEDFLTLVTRSGPVILKRHETFKKIFENGMPAQINNVDCIMACGNIRNTILYPCRHLHLCKECWFLLKTYESKKIRNSTFEDDCDDSVTIPRCPCCRQGVESSDEVYL